MAVQKALAGTAYIVVDGANYNIAGEASYSTSKVKRETLGGLSGIAGFKESPVAGFIEIEFRDAGNLTTSDFNAMTNVTVTLELVNGKTVVARNAWTTDSQEVNAGEGTGKVRWESPDVTEQTL